MYIVGYGGILKVNMIDDIMYINDRKLCLWFFNENRYFFFIFGMRIIKYIVVVLYW